MRFSNEYGTCQIDDLPGCSQVAVSHSVFILPKFRKKGLGSYNSKLRMERIENLKYNVAICTVDDSNGVEIATLNRQGWRKVWTFESSKTKHFVGVWMKNFNQEKE